MFLSLFRFSLCCYYAHFQIKRIISSDKWFNYLVNFFSFLKNAKNLGQSRNAKRRKKRGWP